MIHGLQILNCDNCPNLTTIPQISGLKTIDCSYCPNLFYIPVIPGLKKLSCCECPSLTIPEIIDLKVFNGIKNDF
jgi:hypothetical protein